MVWGIYGKLEIHPEVPQRLVLVRKCDRVGEIPGPKLKRNAIYRVGDVVLLPLVPPSQIPADAPLSQQLGLKACPKHQGGKSGLKVPLLLQFLRREFRSQIAAPFAV